MGSFKNRYGVDIAVELFSSSSIPTDKCVVIAYGTRGLNGSNGEEIRKFASTLEANGIVAAIPHYFQSTATPASKNSEGDLEVSAAFKSNQNSWIDTVEDCVSYVSELSSINAEHIGLLGFSMGGLIMLRLSKQNITHEVKAVVDFFAPINMGPFQIGANIDKLPPFQIHHGKNDEIVPLEQSKKLLKLARDVGKIQGIDYEAYFYDGQGHGFKTPKAIKDSTDRTVQFFQKHLV